MRDQKARYVGLIVALAVFLTACTAAPPPATLPAPAVMEESGLPESSATPLLVQGTLEVAVPANEQTESGENLFREPAGAMPTSATVSDPEPVASSPTPTRTVRNELAATDPETVQLASGEPQLVEFFAFW